jgi:hypothetical protein
VLMLSGHPWDVISAAVAEIGPAVR